MSAFQSLAPPPPASLATVQDILGSLVARYRLEEVLTTIRQIPAREAKFRPMPAWVTSASGQQQRASRDPKTVVEQVIRKLDNERIQAQIHADAAALERIYADDFIGVGPSGTVRTKPQVISDFTSGDLKFRSITTDDVRVHVYGDAAVETGRSTMDGQDKGKAVPHDTRFTRVWVKQQGCWRLVANHYSSNTSHQ